MLGSNLEKASIIFFLPDTKAYLEIILGTNGVNGTENI